MIRDTFMRKKVEFPAVDKSAFQRRSLLINSNGWGLYAGLNQLQRANQYFKVLLTRADHWNAAFGRPVFADLSIKSYLSSNRIIQDAVCSKEKRIMLHEFMIAREVSYCFLSRLPFKKSTYDFFNADIVISKLNSYLYYTSNFSFSFN